MAFPASPEEGLGFLSSLTRSGIRMGLDRIRRALEALDHPEQDFPALHVAGTNGKGSTCAFAAACLNAGDHRVGLYTSPHLIRVNERIQIGGKEIPDLALGSRILEVLQLYPEAALEPYPLTYFEFLTVVALWHFSRERIQVAVLETGLGGRLDATNTAKTAVAAVTPISFDHMEFLGSSLEEIAREKAGIFKPGVPAVVSRQRPEVLRVLTSTAHEVGASLLQEGLDFSLERSATHASFTYRGRQTIEGISLSLRGGHQAQNAAVAIACLEGLAGAGFHVRPDHIRSGLKSARWPGRFEQIGSSPAVILDGAHNPGGVEALCAALDELFPESSVHLVFGVLEDKDYRSMLRQLLPRCRSAHLTPVPSSRSVSPEVYAADAKALCPDCHAHPSVQEALSCALGQARRSDLVLCTGSLFLLGAIQQQPTKSGVRPLS